MCDCVDKVVAKRIFEAIKKQQSDIAELNKRLRKLEEIHERKEKENRYSDDLFYSYNWDNECRNG